MSFSIHFEVYEGSHELETLTDESVIINKILVDGEYKQKVIIGDRIYRVDDETTTINLDELFDKKIAGYSVQDHPYYEEYC